MAILGNNFPTIILKTSAIRFEKEQKEKRKKWEIELFCKQEEKGAFNNLIQKIKLADR